MVRAEGKPRYVVREKPSKSGRGRWAVIDRFKHKVDSRYVYESSAEYVADELNRQNREAVARMAPVGGGWARDEDGWLLASPLVAPAEIDDRDAVAPADRAWWSRQAVEALEERERIEALEEDQAFDAWVSSQEAEHRAREFEEQELAEMGVLPRRQPAW